MSKGVEVSPIPCGDKIWDIKMLFYNQNKCDFMFILLDGMTNY